MPTVLLVHGFRFFFYSNENEEPAHVHVTKSRAFGKLWLEPEIIIAYFNGFNPKEQKQILQIANEHCENFKQKWNEYFF